MGDGALCLVYIVHYIFICGVGYLVCGIWCIVYCTWDTAYGMRLLLHCTVRIAFCALRMVYGTEYSVEFAKSLSGIWGVVYGIWYMVYCI